MSLTHRRNRVGPPRPYASALLVASLLAGSVHAQESDAASAEQFPRLPPEAPVLSGALAPCELQGMAAAAQCGVFRVPEDWAGPQSSPTQDVSFIIITNAERPLPDPVVLMPGGPGDAPTGFVAPLSRGYAALLESRRMVVFDPRGTGRFDALSCHHAADGPILGEPIPLRRVEACLATLRDKTALPGYTSEAIARDVEALRAWLGAPHVNLVGYSYGARLAQVYAKMFPGSVRSLVLNSPVPMDQPIFARMGPNLERALSALDRSCADDPACRAVVPDLGAAIGTLTGRASAGVEASVGFNEQPATIQFTSERLGYTLRTLMYGRAAEVPAFVSRALSQGFNELAGVYVSRLSGVWANFPVGHHLALLCAEDIGRVDADTAEEWNRNTVLGSELIQSYRAACRAWPTAEVDPEFHSPLRSGVPTLILSGALDPVTPPAWGERIARGLSQSMFVLVAAQGHVVGGGCVMDLQAEFISAASVVGLDGTCTTQGDLEFKFEPS